MQGRPSCDLPNLCSSHRNLVDSEITENNYECTVIELHLRSSLIPLRTREDIGHGVTDNLNTEAAIRQHRAGNTIFMSEAHVRSPSLPKRTVPQLARSRGMPPIQRGQIQLFFQPCQMDTLVTYFTT